MYVCMQTLFVPLQFLDVKFLHVLSGLQDGLCLGEDVSAWADWCGGFSKP